MAEYSFDINFQRQLLAVALSDEAFLRSNAECIRPEYFGDEILAGIAEAGLAIWNEHKQVPSKEAILEELKNHVAPGRKFTEYEDEASDILDGSVGNDKGYYLKRAVEFARKQAVLKSILESKVMLEEGDLEGVGQAIAEALRVGSNLDTNDVYSFFDQAKSRLLSYVQVQDGRKGRIPTGFSPLDEAIQGGLAPGEIGVFVGLPGHGKTTALVNCAARVLETGRSVAYITFELCKEIIASKFDTIFFGGTLSEIRKKPKEFAKKIVAKRQELMSNLYIVERPTKSVTPDQIEAIVRKLGHVDMVCVDYGQLVKAPRKRDKEYQELTDIYYELRRMAGELQVPVLTAHQANRPGMEVRTLQMQHVAGDFEIMAIVDLAVSINQTEEEATRGDLRLYVMKSRLGPSGDTIECKVNWHTANITVATDEALG